MQLNRITNICEYKNLNLSMEPPKLLQTGKLMLGWVYV